MTVTSILPDEGTRVSNYKEGEPIMKSSIKKILAIVVLSLGVVVPNHAQQTDPTLTAAVLAQTAELKNIHKQRKRHRRKSLPPKQQ